MTDAYNTDKIGLGETQECVAVKLPYHEKAVVAEAKIVAYLLSETHEAGKSKAAFFLRFGFSMSEWEIMREALLKHASTHEVASILDTTSGKHYAVEGELDTPDGRSPLIRTIWMLEHDSDKPRLITAYPLKTK